MLNPLCFIMIISYVNVQCVFLIFKLFCLNAYVVMSCNLKCLYMNLRENDTFLCYQTAGAEFLEQ